MKRKDNGECEFSFVHAMFNMVEKVAGDVDVMKYVLGDLAKKVEANERNNEKNTEQQKEIADMFSKMKQSLEVTETKEKTIQVQHEEDIHSNRKVDDEASSAAPS